MLLEAEPLDHFIHSRRDHGVRNSREDRVPDQSGLRAPLRIDCDQLGEIPDSVSLDVRPGWESADLDCAGCRPEIAKHHRDEGSLPRAIRSCDAEYLAFDDLQRKLLDRFYRVAEE